jgi:hypothetical protein
MPPQSRYEMHQFYEMGTAGWQGPRRTGKIPSLQGFRAAIFKVSPGDTKGRSEMEGCEKTG